MRLRLLFTHRKRGHDMSATFGCFITGTDTDVGKTLVSSALLHVLAQSGIRAAGMKPVAAGAVLRDGVWHNDDADALAEQASIALPPALATPYLLREAAAPHIAAELEGVVIELGPILESYTQVARLADAVVVEGVGGFRVPLSKQVDTADLMRQLGLPVIMVVGLRLGCLNHALLTADAIRARGLLLAGWVANQLDPELPYSSDNVDALVARLQAPLLGCVPRLEPAAPAAAADYLDFTCLPGWPGAASSPHTLNR
jgi:dethiobiotin synthetase